MVTQKYILQQYRSNAWLSLLPITSSARLIASWPPNLVFWVVLFFGNEKIGWIWPSMRPIRLVDDLLDTFFILFVFSQGFEIVQWQWMAPIAL